MKPTQKSNVPQNTSPHTPRYKVTGSVKRERSIERPGRPVRATRTVNRKINAADEVSLKAESFKDRFNGWRLGFSVDVGEIFKVIVTALLLVFFVILQTTFFTRFRPFGAVPDLMLPFVIAIASLEKYGAIVALIAAYVIDAAGGSSIMLLPLLYVPAAYAVGILITHWFEDSFAVAALFTVISSVLRGVITFIIAAVSIEGITPWQIFCDMVFPELGANILMAAFPQLLTRLCIKRFRKTRNERLKSS